MITRQIRIKASNDLSHDEIEFDDISLNHCYRLQTKCRGGGGCVARGSCMVGGVHGRGRGTCMAGGVDGGGTCMMGEGHAC